jgi:hypothetical protein
MFQVSFDAAQRRNRLADLRMRFGRSCRGRGSAATAGTLALFAVAGEATEEKCLDAWVDLA